jgi:hypothetical protein
MNAETGIRTGGADNGQIELNDETWRGCYDHLLFLTVGGSASSA